MSEQSEIREVILRQKVMEMADHDIRVDEIARTLHISEERVKTIIREEVNT